MRAQVAVAVAADTDRPPKTTGRLVTVRYRGNTL